jgi:ribosomal protein L20
MKTACVEIDRKVLSDIAIHDPQGFSKVVGLAKGEQPA